VTTRRLLRADDPAEARIATGGVTLVLEPAAMPKMPLSSDQNQGITGSTNICTSDRTPVIRRP
jgi:hypothetical protein